MTATQMWIRDLADRVVGAVPWLDETAQSVAVSVYRLLSEGEPVSLKRVADAVQVDEKVVRGVVDSIPTFLDHGRIIGFAGLMVADMPPHHITIDGRTLSAWCAWDTLFLPGILGKRVLVESLCPTTRTPIRLDVGPDRIYRVEPETAVVSFLTPNKPFDRDVIVSFCHFVHFFRNLKAASKWTTQHPGTFVMTLKEAFLLGELTNATNFGKALDLVTPAPS